MDIRDELVRTAKDLVSDKRGILAADESTGSIKKRFDKIGLESTPENHRRYRQLLFTTPEIEKYISGVIMFDETIRQSTNEGRPFPQLLADRGIMPGIKVDEGKFEMPSFPGEYLTVGLKGLRERFIDYKNLGARFAKWRVVVPINKGSTSRVVANANMQNMAIYASLAQEQGIVPIVEPEVLMDGKHSVKECAEVTKIALEFLFTNLFEQKVVLEGSILKVNMIVPGKESGVTLTPQEVAENTVEVLRESVSVAIPSVVFLSGGLSPQDSTKFLDAVNKLGPHPWEVNFSFGRALQEPVLMTWQGRDENIEAAQKEFLKRARLNSLALRGEYEPSMEEI